MRPRAPTRVLLLALGLTAAPACEEQQACTSIGCGGGFELWLSTGSPTPPLHTEYSFLFDVDDTQIDIVCRAPDETGDTGNGGNWTCDDPAQTGPFSVLIESLPLPSIIISRYEGSDVRGPQTVSVQIRAQDELVGEQTFTPQYAPSAINGEGCGVCDGVVSERMNLPAQ